MRLPDRNHLPADQPRHRRRPCGEGRVRLILLASAALALSAGAAPSDQAMNPSYSATAGAVANIEAALNRIGLLNPRLNAVIAVDPTALDQARNLDRQGRHGPLFGMPILIKDNIETSGPLATTAGSLALSDNVTGRDAPLVPRLRAAGAVIIGKSNLSEWANIRSTRSISGWSAVGGQTRNPHFLDRNACGSSSGSAVAVAAGMVPAAIGTETDGSITCPAAVNGIVGFKPSVGLVSRTHIIPISHSHDTAGPMARNVRDAALVLSAIAGSDPADLATRDADRHKTDYVAGLASDSLRGARLGVLRFATGFGTDAAFEQALHTLRAQGAILVDIGKLDGRNRMRDAELKVLLTELKADLNLYLSTLPASVASRSLADLIMFNRAHSDREMPLFGQELFEEAERSGGLDDPEYLQARALSLRLAGAEGIDRLLREYDVVALVGPTTSPACLIDSVHGDQYPGSGAGELPAIAGYPHLTVPMGNVHGLPVGISFIGPKWSDALILSLGHAYEQASQQRIEPRFLESVEKSKEVSPHLQPAPR